MRPIKVFMSTTAAPVVTVDIFNTSASHTVTDPSNATATYSLNSSGAGSRTGGAGWTWLTAGNNSDVEVRATVNSGALTSGTVGSWLNLSSTRSWSVAKTTVGVGSANVTIEIRRVSDSVVIDTATVTFIATVNAAPSATVQLFDMHASATSFDTATARISFTNAGVCDMVGAGSSPGDYSWLTSGTASQVDIRVTTTVGGDVPTGSALDTWLNLGTTRNWTLSNTGPLEEWTGTVSLRNASTLAVIAGPEDFIITAEGGI